MKLKIKRLKKLDIITIESTCLQRLEVLTSNNKGCDRNNNPYDRQREACRDRVDLWGRVFDYPYTCHIQCWPWLGQVNSAILSWSVYSNGGSPITTHRAFRIRFVLNRCDPNPNKKPIYLFV